MAASQMDDSSSGMQPSAVFSSQPKKPRSANWTDGEETALMEAYREELSVLEGKATGGSGASLAHVAKAAHHAALTRLTEWVNAWVYLLHR